MRFETCPVACEDCVEYDECAKRGNAAQGRVAIVVAVWGALFGAGLLVWRFAF